MKKNLALTQENFDQLLAWLSPERDEAGKKYEEIRQGLIRFFRFRGCSDPHLLADETINRVASKVSTFSSEKNVKTITYFYGFASKIYLEQIAERNRREVQLNADRLDESSSRYLPTFNEPEMWHDCLESCLDKLKKGDRKIILSYYSRDKSAKFEHRRKLAEKLNLNPGTLHTRVHRLRHSLRSCTEKCVNK